MTNHRWVLLLSSMLCWWSPGSMAALQDPTRPVAVEQQQMQAQHSEAVLSAIIISADSRIAVINGRIFHVGDELDNMKVIAINPTTVEIERPSGRQILTLLTNPRS